MVPDDPWKMALDALSARPPRVTIAPGRRGASWRPAATRNPRHSAHGPFSEIESVEFVRRRVREIVDGTARAMMYRGESLQAAPSRWAFVLVVHPLRPRPSVPPLYVKWTLVAQADGTFVLEFISFHDSTHSP
jgi:hypothetical protein